MRRHNLILAGALILQIALAVVLLWPRAGVSGGGGEALLGDFDTSAVSTIMIWDGDGNHVVLSKSGGEWVLPEADDYPCTPGLVSGFLDRLASITKGRLVTRTSGSHVRLKVSGNDYERRISLQTDEGEERVVYLGTAPNYGVIHVRLEGVPATYLTSVLSARDANAKSGSWVEAGYFSVDQETILSMDLENANGAWTFQKDEEGNWTMLGLQEGEEFNLSNFTPVVTRASAVNMTEPLGTRELSEYGFDNPLALVTIKTAEGTFVLTVGAQDPTDNSYVVQSSESAYYVRVSEFSVRELVERQRGDFIQVPATPTAEGGG